ncbi:hypothetical protein ACFYOP_08110 [Streptomyces sp. NPDC006294]
MDTDHATPAQIAALRAAFGAAFGHTTAESGFAGWVAHWAAAKDWWDAA